LENYFPGTNTLAYFGAALGTTEKCFETLNPGQGDQAAARYKYEQALLVIGALAK
jgi:hypothetical protein